MAEFPVYKFVVSDDDEEVGMVGLSLVETPAFESKFVAFNKQEKKEVKQINFVEDKKYKQVLTGLCLIPDKLIYRYDKELGDYMGFFDAAEIEKIRNKFHKQHFTSNVNINHNQEDSVDAYLIESYILDTEDRVKEAISRGVTDAVLHSWMVSYKVEDEEVFQKVLDGELVGFSIESYLTVLTNFSKNKNNFNVKKSKMKSKFEKIRDKILSIFTELEFSQSLVPELGFEIQWGEVGETVSKVLPQQGDEDAVLEPVGEGEYTTEVGVVVVDEASNLVEVKELPAEEEAPAEEEVELIKAKGTYVKGEETIEAEVSYSEVDAPVLIDDTPINEVVEITETAEVELESGQILVVGEDGLLDEIKEEGEVVIEEEAPAEEFKDKKKFATSDMDKKLKDLIGDRVGEYSINVSIDANGNFTWGSINSWSELVFKADHTKEIRKYQKEVKNLKIKLAKPVADPVLTNDKQEKVDVSKLSTYERLMHEKGLEPVYKSRTK